MSTQEVGILKKMLQSVLDSFGDVKTEKEIVEVTKSLMDEERRALFVVLAPQEGETTDDLHGDTYTAEEVEKACNNFNTHCMKANLFHQIETEDAKIVQSFITPSAFKLDDGREIKKGTWLQWWHFPEGNETSEALWAGVKAGTFNGVSIQGRAMAEELE